jgi:cobalt transporter subunit CbtB
MANQVSIVSIHRTAAILTTISKPLQLVSALLLGAVILYAAGFVSASAVHNAAHDMRHSQGFPCH